jgi:hypothetical protein
MCGPKRAGLLILMGTNFYSVHLGQASYSMGPEWKGFHVHVTKGTTSSKGFSKSNKKIPHLFFILCHIHNSVNFSSAGKINHMKEITKCAFILGIISTDAKSLFLTPGSRST